jgi:hypothetical protein
MTKKEAKEISLEAWRYLAAHPEIEYKRDLPESIFSKIISLIHYCPLCAVHKDCKGCPLYEDRKADCSEPNNVYYKWSIAYWDYEREEFAQEIVRRIEAWEV